MIHNRYLNMSSIFRSLRVLRLSHFRFYSSIFEIVVAFVDHNEKFHFQPCIRRVNYNNNVLHCFDDGIY